jgi:hypothetical protein
MAYMYQTIGDMMITEAGVAVLMTEITMITEVGVAVLMTEMTMITEAAAAVPMTEKKRTGLVVS